MNPRELFLIQLTNGCDKIRCSNPYCRNCSKFIFIDKTHEEIVKIAETLSSAPNQRKNICKTHSALYTNQEFSVFVDYLNNWIKEFMNKNNPNIEEVREQVRKFGSYLPYLLHCNNIALSKENSAIDDILFFDFVSRLYEIYEIKEELDGVILNTLKMIKNSDMTTYSSVRAFILLFYFPGILNAMELDKVMKPIIKRLISYPKHVDKILIKWFSRLSNALKSAVGFCQFCISTYFSRHLDIDPHNSTVFDLVQSLNILFEANQNSLFHLPSKIFYNYHINSRIDPLKELSRIRKSFTSYPYILSLQTKAKICQIQSESLMITMILSSFVSGFVQSIFSGEVNIEPFFTITVHRDSILDDAINQLMEQKPSNYLKKFSVNFENEQAVDAGGPSREFFYLISEDIFMPDKGMFKIVEDKYLWFNNSYLDDIRIFKLAGIIIGLAVYNMVVLPIRFPYVLYKKIMHSEKKMNLNDLTQIDSVLAKSLNDLKQMKLRGENIADIGLTFEITVENFGEMINISLVPGKGNEEVTNDNVDEYIQAYIDYILKDSVQIQFEAFKEGFKLPCHTDAYSFVDPTEMDILVSGEEILDWGGLQRSVEYSDGYDANSQQIQWFWSIFNDFSTEEKKQFLKFSTGTDKVPFGGLENVHITIQKSTETNSLPISHTCFNIFTLPEYSSKEILEQKVKTAIQYTEGFGFI